MRISAGQCEDFIRELSRESIMVQAIDDIGGPRPATIMLGINPASPHAVIYGADTGAPVQPTPGNKPGGGMK